MITSIFNKTRPINYIILSVLLVVFYTIFLLGSDISVVGVVGWLKKIVTFFILLASLFLMHFIYNRNNLVKDNMYGAYLAFLFCLLFPQIFEDSDVVFSLFLLILAFRRLISLRSKLSVKQKLFDSCVLILLASLFYFWNILFLSIVFFVILFQTSFDFKNWFIPFIAIAIVGTIVIMIEMISDSGYIFSYINAIAVSFKMSILFNNKVELVMLSFYAILAVLLLFSSFITYGSRSANQHSVYNIFYFILLISAAIFLFDPLTNLAVLSYTFFPMAIFGANMIEGIERKWIKESFLATITIFVLVLFFIQL